ncbi:hypothetical protein SDRG_01386 [Saprolegnia diclina VS20]|uniref:Tubulin--tyrosine ligase-like protein 5 n=1 Tax=Saprolegnia diclina (strain VS20) TaxID=1156394 RepID=T0SER7_SAPDV|nr:hypothetical protein SDRG_01386 [Saprolegnia diclina VS20]EQC41417.1 hypothetical protein SDRG_01386 [Saprolegnia diclina VS20]|eukprot:XP_008605131.1 hypothetical protein SDRG_01386 [Saprolegnia diclina VS20]
MATPVATDRVPDDDENDDANDEDNVVDDNEIDANDTGDDGGGLHVLVSATTPPVLFCKYPSYLALERTCPIGYEVRTLPRGTPMLYHGTRRYLYNAVKNVLHTNRAKKTTLSTWSLFWGRHLEPSAVGRLVPGQKMNHFPGSLELGRKDKLCANILRMQRKFGKFFHIIPETHVTGSKDGRHFMQAYAADPKAIWILKPPNQCCGRGIKLVSGSAKYEFEPDKRYVAQKYIAHPYLINGFKFDMRLYVLVTSYDPLRVYLFDNGLVRFCTQKYSMAAKDLKNRFGHLTNYSVNKKNEAFQSNQGSNDGSGSKWSFQALLAHLRDEGHNCEKLHDDIAAVIVKTLLCVESAILAQCSKSLKTAQNCFELYGFDILLDANLRPWLLEVNVFPSMSSSSPMDKRIKSILICDTFQLVGLPATDVAAAVEQAKKERSTRRKSSISTKPEDDDAAWIQQLVDEEARMGHFRRIFPTPATASFLDFFETKRASNAVLAEHVGLSKPTRPSVRKTGSFSNKLQHAKVLNAAYSS